VTFAQALHFRRDHLHLRKVGAVRARVAREDGQARDLRMRADEEVGQHARAGPAGPAVPQIRFSGQEEGRNRRAVEGNIELRESILDIGLVGESGRELGVDRFVDDDRPVRGLPVQLLGRPVEPSRIAS